MIKDVCVPSQNDDQMTVSSDFVFVWVLILIHFERVPNADFDVVLYQSNSPVVLTMKTSLRERYKLNEDPAVKDQSLILRFGSNSDQIQVSRILMSYLFMKLTDTFGNVPYWSYGQRDNRDFQALRLGDRGKRIPNPKYTDAQVIYRDMLAELKDAADKLTQV